MSHYQLINSLSDSFMFISSPMLLPHLVLPQLFTSPPSRQKINKKTFSSKRFTSFPSSSNLAFRKVITSIFIQVFNLSQLQPELPAQVKTALRPLRKTWELLPYNQSTTGEIRWFPVSQDPVCILVSLPVELLMRAADLASQQAQDSLPLKLRRI